MKGKSICKGIPILLVFSLLFISLSGFVSADFVADSNLHVTLDKDYSEAVLHLADADSGYDEVEIPFSCSDGKLSINNYELPDEILPPTSNVCSTFASMGLGTEGRISFNISDLVNGINFTAEFNNSQTSPEILSVSINGLIPIYTSNNPEPLTLGNILMGLRMAGVSDITINDLNNPEFLTSFIADYSTNTIPMRGNAQLMKNGNTVILTYDRGFGENSEEYISYIENVIKFYAINTFNIENLIDNSLTMASIPSSYQDFIDYYEANSDKFNYDVSVDLSGLELTNGDHNIPVTLSQNGEDITTKEISLTLSGLPAYASPYVPSDSGILEWLSQITSLPLGSNVIVTILGTQSTGANIKFLSAMEITVGTPNAQGDIYFKVDKSLVSDKNKISLYVLEGTTWTKLTTTFLNDNGVEYEYSAHTPHFSTFMIGEDTSTTTTTSTTTHHHGSSSWNNVGEIVGGAEQNLGDNSNPSEPMDYLNNGGASITGGVIGFVKSPVGISLIAGLVIAVATVGFFSFKKRKTAEKE